MRRLLLRLWSLWFYLLFAGFFLLIFPFHLVLLQTKWRWAHNFCHWLNKVWGYVIMYPTGVWVTREGHRQLDPKQVYIFAPNHSSYLDIPICNVSVGPTFRFIGKAELNRTPFFGYMFKRLHIPVNRGSVTESYKSFVQAKEVLKDGTSVLLFPEGTIPDKTKVTLLRFKDGAFRMAIELGIPIVPVSIMGADRALPDDGRFLLHPSRVRVVFHTPIETAQLQLSDATTLKDQVYRTIYEQLTGQPLVEAEPARTAT